MTAADNSLFRKVALERLSSPEQLDQLVSLSSARVWIAAWAALAMVLALFVWSLFGTLDVTVPGSGLLIARGGQLFDATAGGTGTVVWAIRPGAHVREGMVLARLDGGARPSDIRSARSLVAERQAALTALDSGFKAQMAAVRTNDLAQEKTLAEVAQAAGQEREFYQGQLVRRQQLLARGFITPAAIQEARKQIDQAAQQADQARSDVLRLNRDELDLRTRRDHELLAARQAVGDAERNVTTLELQYRLGTEVTSPHDGIVTEIKVSPGMVVTAGRPVASVASSASSLEMLMFVPPAYGKRVRSGMAVDIVPATVRKEEHGALLGRVLSISDFPSTSEGMMAVLQNAALVQRLMASGPPYAARVALYPAATPSGYRWTGVRGPAMVLTGGTTASADVIVEHRSPISFLIPSLKIWSGFGV